MEDNVILIGSKPFGRYLTSAIMSFTKDGKDKVIIKARGHNITKAVDIAETAKRKLTEENLKTEVIIGNEEKEGKENRPINVSTIEITLSK